MKTRRRVDIPFTEEQMRSAFIPLSVARQRRTTKKELPMGNHIMKYFEYAHLPEHLQEVSKPIGELAKTMDASLPDGPEKSAGLRKLLEAKDCLVRAKLG